MGCHGESTRHSEDVVVVIIPPKSSSCPISCSSVKVAMSLSKLRTRPAGLLPALPPDALLHVLSLLEPADVAAAAEAFPEEVGAVTRADWAWGPLWRGKRFQAEDVDEVLAVVRAAPPCDKAVLYVGWPLPAVDTTNKTTGIVSLVFGAANR
ncbi:hypothetical protein FOCC_FOCC006519, partial [Frankliniella occidentalis]